MGLLFTKIFASLVLCHALDLIDEYTYVTLKYHYSMFNILIRMT